MTGASAAAAPILPIRSSSSRRVMPLLGACSGSARARGRCSTRRVDRSWPFLLSAGLRIRCQRWSPAQDECVRWRPGDGDVAADREAGPGLGCQDGQGQAARRADLVRDGGAEIGGLLDRRGQGSCWPSAGTISIDSGRTLISIGRAGRDAVVGDRARRRRSSSRTRPSASTVPRSRLVVPMKSATKRRRRALVQLLGRAELLDPAVVHDRDPVAHRERLLLVVGHVHERDPDLAPGSA